MRRQVTSRITVVVIEMGEVETLADSRKPQKAQRNPDTAKVEKVVKPDNKKSLDSSKKEGYEKGPVD